MLQYTAPHVSLRRAPAWRRLPFALRRRVVRSLSRRRRSRSARLPATSQRSVRWLQLLAGIVVMAVLFTVLLAAAAPALPGTGLMVGG